MSDDDRDDPFKEFDEPADREGDPFEHLGAPDKADEPSVGTADDAVTEEFALDEELEAVTDDGPLSAGETDPFSGMAARGGDPFGAGEGVFEAVDVGSVDADEVWASLAEDGDGRETAGVTRYADVSKHRYCERCEHFSGPPEVGCTREDTEIVEFLDMETVRLLDCPVVAEQRRLGNEE
ncbi:hypothetical protein [Haloarcula nitratireducens]|uniref:DUF8135 domain-containing protein n=1 Tax=Haloarcula nitratireducens TaxID=2487749 RepID=A0AAW4PAX3_9EURY|nr:hypothetical protein [Halomicroarcula nitratireducens]MBX0295051.1 hypothetical protein [Halomicroarcula nitratireducens]